MEMLSSNFERRRRRERERRRERKKRVTMAPRRQVTVEFDAACGSFRSDEREELRLRTRRRSVVVDLNEISGEGREEGRSGYSRCQVTLRQVLSHVEATTTTKVRENVEWISLKKRSRFEKAKPLFFFPFFLLLHPFLALFKLEYFSYFFLSSFHFHHRRSL